MSELKASWQLKEELNLLQEECSDELKKEISNFIKANDADCTGGRGSFVNLLYRASLHYIIDKFSDPKLLPELMKYNRTTLERNF